MSPQSSSALLSKVVMAPIAYSVAAMETSIHVSREMHERLKALKERMKAKTFEELLERLLERSRRSPLERFGARPRMKAFAHVDESHEP